MSALDVARRISDATERIARADARLTSLLGELEVLTRADKTYVSEAVREALEELAVARDALRALVDITEP